MGFKGLHLGIVDRMLFQTGMMLLLLQILLSMSLKSAVRNFLSFYYLGMSYFYIHISIYLHSIYPLK